MKKRDMFIGLFIAVIMAGLSFFASSLPDGLERIAQDKNFILKAAAFLEAPVPDYIFPGISNKKLSVSLAGITGVLIIFILAVTVARIIKKQG